MGKTVGLPWGQEIAMSEESAAKDLEGVWFHDFYNQVLDLHGQVLAMLPDNLMRVQLFDESVVRNEMPLKPARQMIVPRGWLLGMTVYESEWDWVVAWKTHEEESA